MTTTEIIRSETGLDAALSAGQGALVLLCTANWASSAREVARSFAAVAGAGRAAAAILDIDEEPAVARRLGLRYVPTLLLFVDGQERARTDGVLGADQMRAWLAANGQGDAA